ncbi:MAG: GntR family transcriptional regulator [Eubacteriales bacterium]
MTDNPIHIQIANDIKQQIELGIYKKNDLLPSENTLANQYHVSRITVQKSLRILNNESYIYSVPGKGSFAKEPPINQYILKFSELNLFNKEQQQKLIGVDIINPTPELIYALQVHPNKKVIHLKHVIFIDSEPIAFDSKYIPYYSGVPIVEVEINYSAFPDILSNIISPYKIGRELNIYGSVMDDEVGEVLQLELGAPCIIVEQKLFDADNSPIGWRRMHLNIKYFRMEGFKKVVKDYL